MIATTQTEHRAAYEAVNTPGEVPLYSLVPVRGPDGEVLDAYRGVQRQDNQQVVNVVSSRYGLVGHRDVALVAHQLGAALEAPEAGTLADSFPRESIRLYAGGRRMEVKIVVGRKFHLAEGEDLYPGLRILNSLDGSWALRLSGFAVRLACSNQLFAEVGNVTEWRELHLSSTTDLLGQLGKAVHDFLGHFSGGLGLYTRSMRQEMLADEVAPALLSRGIPQVQKLSEPVAPLVQVPLLLFQVRGRLPMTVAEMLGDDNEVHFPDDLLPAALEIAPEGPIALVADDARGHPLLLRALEPRLEAEPAHVFSRGAVGPRLLGRALLPELLLLLVVGPRVLAAEEHLAGDNMGPPGGPAALAGRERGLVGGPLAPRPPLDRHHGLVGREPGGLENLP